MARRGAAVRRVGRSLIGIGVVAAGVWVVSGALAASGAERFERWVGWANILALLVGSVGVALVVFGRTAGSRDGDDERLLARLAVRVRTEWAREAASRQVTRPAPVMTRWSSTGRPADAGAGETPLSGRLDAIVDAFLALDRQRLVVLGAPGAGKTVLAMLFTIGLIDRRAAGEPVPVMLSLSDWNPDEHLDDFVVRRIAEDHHEVLAEAADSGAVRALVEAGLIVAVLDGLDELPFDRQPDALIGLDRYAAEGRPLLVTCRVGEYERAVDTKQVVISQAAVVELLPVDVDAVIAFLSHPLPRRPRWAAVFERLKAEPDGPLAWALSTPLTVNLARAAYQRPDADPGELLLLPTEQAITDRLLDAFVEDVFTDEPAPRDGRSHRRTVAYPSALRWLSYLSVRLDDVRQRHLDWSAVVDHPLGVSGGARRLIRPALVVGLLLAAVLIGAQGGGPWAGLRGATSAAILLWAVRTPVFFTVWWRDDLLDWYRWLRPGRLFTGVMFGLVCGSVVALWHGEWLFVLGAGALGGLVVGALPAPRWFLAMEPALGFGAGRAAAVVAFGAVRNAAAAAVASAALAWAVAGEVAGFTTPAVAVVSGVLTALGGGGTRWLRRRAAHVRLAMHGWLPWRLGTFLDLAYQRGVLRRTGHVYEFRHALLQRRLADRAREAVLRVRANRGDRMALHTLADLLVARNDLDGAAEVLARRLGRFDEDGQELHAQVLVQLGRVDELWERARPDVLRGWVRRWLAGRPVPYEDGWPNPYETRFADLLVERRDIEGLTAQADRTRDGYTAGRLADLLVDGGDDAALRTRTAAGDVAAVRGLAVLLRQRGELGAALDLLVELHERHDRVARQYMVDLLLPAPAGDRGGTPPPLSYDDRVGVAGLLLQNDRIDGAVAVLRRRGRRMRAEEATALADVLATHGRTGELRELADRRGSRFDTARARLAELAPEPGDAGEPSTGPL